MAMSERVVLQATQSFLAMQTEAPYSSRGLELCSTALWHLKDRTMLATLAKHLSKIDPGSPEACIASGNYSSLNGNHARALELFVKAGRLDPTNATALTLAGHEEAAQGHVEEATRLYREALTRNPRQYNAWFGLVSVWQHRLLCFEGRGWEAKRRGGAVGAMCS